MERQRNYADPAKSVYMAAGPLTFGIEYRHLQNDEGLCIHVFRDRDGTQEELLRRDIDAALPKIVAWAETLQSQDRHQQAQLRR